MTVAECPHVKLNNIGLRDVVEQLRRIPAGLDATLAKVVPFGTAYHHAGKNNIFRVLTQLPIYLIHEFIHLILYTIFSLNQG